MGLQWPLTVGSLLVCSFSVLSCDMLIVSGICFSVVVTDHVNVLLIPFFFFLLCYQQELARPININKARLYQQFTMIVLLTKKNKKQKICQCSTHSCELVITRNPEIFGLFGMMPQQVGSLWCCCVVITVS